MASKLIPLSNFVVIGPGEWQSGTNLAETVAKLRKRLPKAAAKAALKVFGSDGEIKVSADIYVRVQVGPDSTLVEFEL